MKSVSKWIIIITTAIIFLYGFSISYSSQNIDNLDYVIAIGIDSVPDSDNLEISFEFANPSFFSENGSEDSKPIIDTVSTRSISNAVNILNAYVGKQVNLAHCKIVVFSEDVAKKGVLDDIAFLMNNTQVRPTTNIIVSSGKAKNYIENSMSSLEKVLVKYYDVFPASSDYTGYTADVLLNNFYADLINKDSGAVAILGITSESTSNSSEQNSSSQSVSNSSEQNSSSQSASNSSEQNSSSENTPNSSEQNSSSPDSASSSNEKAPISDKNSLDEVLPGESIVKGDRGTENMGLCIFKDAKHIGHLSAIETLCYSLVSNTVDNFMVSIDNPFEEGKKIDLSVSSLSSSCVNVEITPEKPIITLKLNITAKTLTSQDTLDYSDKKVLDKLNETLSNYLNDELNKYLEKTSKEYKCDINRFYNFAKKKFITTKDYTNYNWEQKYQNSEFKIDINSSVISSLLIQNS